MEDSGASLMRDGPAWKLRLLQQELRMVALLQGKCPARLKAADACELITILCWPDGWSHGADSIWQACNDATQCAQAAGPRPDDILVRGLAAEPPRSEGSRVPADQSPTILGSRDSCG